MEFRTIASSQKTKPLPLCNEEANEISLSPELSYFPVIPMPNTTASHVCIYLPGRSFSFLSTWLMATLILKGRYYILLLHFYFFLIIRIETESSHWTEWKNGTPKENRKQDCWQTFREYTNLGSGEKDMMENPYEDSDQVILHYYFISPVSAFICVLGVGE